MTEPPNVDSGHTQRPREATAAAAPGPGGRRLLVGVALLAAVLLTPLAFVWVMLSVARGAVWALAELREHIAATGWVVLVLILIWLAAEVRMMMRAGRDGADGRSMPRRRRFSACVGCAAIMVMGNGALEIASGRVEAHWEARKRDGVDLYRNHDLSRLVGQCIRLSLLRHAETIGRSGVQRDLTRLAETVPDRWEALAAAGDARVMRLGDAQLSRFILEPDAAALSADEFGALLRDWRRQANLHALSEADLDAAAAAISRDLGITLREALKSDFQRGGKAWAAMQLDIAQSLLAALSAGTASADIASAIADLHALVADHASALPALSDLLHTVAAADERHARAVLERFDATAAQLARLEETTRAIRDDTMAIRADTGTIRDDTAALRQDTGAIRGDTGAIRQDTGTIAGTLDSVLSSVKDVTVLQRELNERFLAHTTIGQRAPAEAAVPDLSTDPAASAQIEADFAAYEAARRTTGSRPFFVETAPLRSRLWEREARAGNAAAAVLIGRTIQEGIGMEPNQPAARAWYEQAADAGSAAGLFNLALMHEDGEGGFPQSHAAALRLYIAAAELGHEGAMAALGTYTRDGRGGVISSTEAALVWYERAIALGDTHAMNLAAYHYHRGTEVRSADPDAALALFRRSAAAGNEEARGIVAAEILGACFRAYTTEGAGETAREAALAEARSALGVLRISSAEHLLRLLNRDSIWTILEKLNDASAHDPMRQLLEELNVLTIERFLAADESDRVRLLDGFARATAATVSAWTRNNEHHRVVEFWKLAYRGVPLASRTQGEQDQMLAQIKACVVSLYTLGYRADAARQTDEAFVMFDAIIAQRPWDWYLRGAATHLGWEAGAAALHAGDHENAQRFLRRGWTVQAEFEGQEDLIARTTILPVKGVIPPGIPEKDTAYFRVFALGSADRDKADPRWGLIKFTVPFDFEGRKIPIAIYLHKGPRGYRGLQEQFIWWREYRRGIVPPDVEDSFRRLNDIARENNVDFADLCVYALGTNDAAENKP
ncbi:MAG: DUF2610 domain-containing protein [Phycisphaeraceae bacterium]|nr:DUF2610 domain-containing protein [Phycisphaeraceae bacterium]MCW5763318.1 DUF2610 domain-containing protein [Phycisphaeraceae bacterium]